MLNQVVLVGRLANDVETLENENGVKRAVITLACPRSYKNADGVYETDFIPCYLWNGIAENTAEYCRKGDVIGIRGRLQTSEVNNEDGTVKRTVEIIAEKVTFLSSRKPEEEEKGE